MFDWNPSGMSWLWNVGSVTNVGKRWEASLSFCEEYIKDSYFFYSPEVSLNNCTTFLSHQGSLSPNIRIRQRSTMISFFHKGEHWGGR